MSLHVRRPLSESIQLNDAEDIATVYGVQISGELLRTLGEPTPPGQWFRVIKTDDGVSTIQTKFEPEFKGDVHAEHPVRQ